MGKAFESADGYFHSGDTQPLPRQIRLPGCYSMQPAFQEVFADSTGSG
jgi:hypothetical protein